MRYRIRLIVEIICRLRGYTATDSIRLLLLLPFVAIISFIAKRINSIRKAILRKYRIESIELLDLLGKLIKSTYLKVIINKRTALFVRSNNLQEDFTIATLLHEPFVAKIFKPDPGDVVIDVGAHIGSYTVRCAKAVGEKGLVIAFEPDPENFKVLLLNVKMNNLKNVIAFPYAVGKSNGIIKLHKSKFTGFHSTVRFPQGYIGSIKVKVITLDALTENIGVKKIDWIKIDVEGGEAEVLEGAVNTLKLSKRIIIEVWKSNLKRVLNLVSPNKFEARAILESYILYYILFVKSFNSIQKRV